MVVKGNFNKLTLLFLLMGDVEFLGQLVSSMAEAVRRLEQAKARGDSASFNKLKVFIFDVSQKIDLTINSIDVKIRGGHD